MFGKKPTENPFQSLSQDQLLAAVQTGDIDMVRRHFDAELSKGKTPAPPQWRHLHAALLREDMPMMRLLITWGARPNDLTLAALPADQLRQLRLAGLVIKQQEKNTPPPGEKIDRNDQKAGIVRGTEIEMPAEWRDVLQAVQVTAKAPEAMIVGGALRDLLLARPINDVDIFLKMPIWPGQEQSILKKAFKKAGMRIHPQKVKVTESGYTRRTYYEDRLFTQIGDISNSVYRHSGLGVSSAWLVVAGPNHTKYNVIFIDSPHILNLRHKAKEKPENLAPMFNYIKMLDIGICQVAYRGGPSFCVSNTFLRDARNKTLTLANPSKTTYEHACRVADKYSDFTPDDAYKAILETPPRGHPPRNPYSALPPG